MQYYALPRFTFSVAQTIELYGNYHILSSKLAQFGDMKTKSELRKLLKMVNDFIEFYEKWCSMPMSDCPISKGAIAIIERKLKEM